MFRQFASMTVLVALLVSLLTLTAAADNQSLTAQRLNQMPLSFTKNMGQWDDRVLFRANAGGATMWLTKEGVTYQFTRHISTENTPLNPLSRGDSHSLSGTAASEPIPLLRGVRGVSDKDSIEQLVLTAKFIGANPNPEVYAEGQMEYKCNYFLGNDPTKWHTDVPNYEAIMLKDIYPGIDLKYSGDGDGQAAYEFIVAPGADVAQIKVEYEGAEETSLDSDGRLIVRTKWGDMVAAIKSPAYAPLPLGEGSGVRESSSVLSGPASFSHLSENAIGFKPDGTSQQALGTLSVGLVYSTYLGGAGQEGSVDGPSGGIAVDDSGNAYVTGRTSSFDFPTLNPYQTGGGVFVTKLSSSGNSLIYSTYLGGGGYDYGNGIAVDNGGYAYVTGGTGSSNFPTLNPYQTYRGSYDAFVTKLSSTGNSLIYSTYLGGADYDEGHGIAVDGSGNAYVTGMTSSSNFPTRNPYQGTYQDEELYCQDAFVTKLSSTGNSLIYSTYLGGGRQDRGNGIVVDGSGKAYVVGWTNSSNFPTLNAYQTDEGSKQGMDVFVTNLSSSGSSLMYSTYLGGGDIDWGTGIAVDGSGNAYVTGWTGSTDFPTLNPYQTFQGSWDVFVTKLSNSGYQLIYSTYLGGRNTDEGYGIAVDGSGCAYVTGYTWSPDFPILNPYQGTLQIWIDAFVTKLSSSGGSLIYSTYLGGGDDDWGEGIAVDDSGSVYMTGRTNSSNFPTLNPYQGTYQGGDDAFVTKLYFDVADDISDEMTPSSLPEKPALDQNYPNPFNPSTEIGFDNPKSSFVSLDIYDVLGRKVSTLINEHLTAGSKQVQWNGRDNTGAEVASGVYFYRLRIGDHVEAKKMVLLK